MTTPILRRTGVAVLSIVVSAAGSHAAAQSAVATANALPPAAADAAVFGPNEPARDYKTGKVIHARRILGTPPQIDGRLTDEIWNGGDAATDFLQRDPDNGKPMTEETRIQVAYDTRYLYIAVTCVDASAAGVTTGFGRRDEEPPTDMVNIGLDPRHDHLTGYLFQTNPSSWQGDMSLFDDDSADRDYNSNWEVRSQVVDNGWTAEFRIPFSQMRFTTAPTGGQVWGFDAKREIRRKGEQGFWVARPRGERGDVSRFGHLVFDEPLTPPGRLEVLPYGLTRIERQSDRPNDYGFSGGADVRYGLGSGSTLSATLNPDFGQVEQDPAVLNLSIFETFFPEKRAFFLEDSRTFVPPYGLFQVFHSRRIGRTPGRLPLEPDDIVIGQPADTTIIGAAKLTGKSSGWTYGVLSAETSREYAEVSAAATSTGIAGQRVAPDRTVHVVQRGARAARPPWLVEHRRHRHRRGAREDGRCLHGRLRLQPPLEPDPRQLQRSLGGDARARGGRHEERLRWCPQPEFQSQARQRRHARRPLRHQLPHHRYRIPAHAHQPQPRRRQYRDRSARSRQAAATVLVWPERRPVVERRKAGLRAQLRNVFRVSVPQLLARALRDRREHGAAGRSRHARRSSHRRSIRPLRFIHFESDSRKSWQWNLNLVGGRSRVDSSFTNYQTGISFQPSDRVQASIFASYNKGLDDAQWITNGDQDGDGIIDYVYGTLSRDVVDLTLRATYAFTRDLTLQAYMQPFVAVGDYYKVRKLALPNSYEFTPVTLDYNPDFNSKSLQSNVVLRWEYVKGSTLYAVWNRTQGDPSRPGVFSAFRDLRDAFGAGEANNVFMIKATYWINR